MAYLKRREETHVIACVAHYEREKERTKRLEVDTEKANTAIEAAAYKGEFELILPDKPTSDLRKVLLDAGYSLTSLHGGKIRVGWRLPPQATEAQATTARKYLLDRFQQDNFFRSVEVVPSPTGGFAVKMVVRSLNNVDFLPQWVDKVKLILEES